MPLGEPKAPLVQVALREEPLETAGCWERGGAELLWWRKHPGPWRRGPRPGTDHPRKESNRMVIHDTSTRISGLTKPEDVVKSSDTYTYLVFILFFKILRIYP